MSQVSVSGLPRTCPIPGLKPSNSRLEHYIQLRPSVQFRPPSVSLALEAFVSFRTEASIYLGTWVFHLSPQVSSFKPSVFYFGPSIHISLPPSFLLEYWVLLQSRSYGLVLVLDHLTRQPGIWNHSIMLTSDSQCSAPIRQGLGSPSATHDTHTRTHAHICKEIFKERRIHEIKERETDS